MPAITQAVVIDGYTQPGSSLNTLTSGDNAVINIVLNGASAGTASGLVFSGTGASGSLVEGLDINGFALAGIVTDAGANDVSIAGNFIGTDPSGMTALPNIGQGILISTADNSIGGPAPASANVISGNAGSGVIFTRPLPREISFRATTSAATRRSLADLG